MGIADTADFYRFNLASTSTFNLVLEDLSDSVFVDLIRDANNNGMIDSDERLASRTVDPTSPGSIIQSLVAGNYFVQIAPPLSHNTNYNLTMFTS